MSNSLDVLSLTLVVLLICSGPFIILFQSFQWLQLFHFDGLVLVFQFLVHSPTKPVAGSQFQILKGFYSKKYKKIVKNVLLGNKEY